MPIELAEDVTIVDQLTDPVGKSLFFFYIYIHIRNTCYTS